MRRTARSLAFALVGLGVTASGAAAEPIYLHVQAPARVAARAKFAVTVTVTASPGAFVGTNLLASPLRLRVRLAPECGGTFVGTAGRTAIDRRLRPDPVAGRKYSTTMTGRVRERARGPYAVCAFLEDRDRRQFATSVDTIVTVTRRCTTATRRLNRVRRKLARAPAGSARRQALRSRARRARAAVNRACD